MAGILYLNEFFLFVRVFIMYFGPTDAAYRSNME